MTLVQKNSVLNFGDEPEETLGSRLRNLRDSRKLKQHHVADHIRNVSQSAICSWETGRGTPSSKNLTALAKFFGVTEAYLLHGEDTPKTHCCDRAGFGCPNCPQRTAPFKPNRIAKTLSKSLRRYRAGSGKCCATDRGFLGRSTKQNNRSFRSALTEGPGFFQGLYCEVNMTETEQRAFEARKRLRVHMAHIYKMMKSADNLSREHPHALKELQIVVGALANASAEFRDINARLDGSLSPTEQKKVDPWKDRKHVNYRGPKGWEPATVKKYDPEKGTVRLHLETSGAYKTVALTSGLVR